MAAKGTKNADFLSGNKEPPNRAIAASGVKFGKWGNKRESAAIKIAIEININLGLKKFDFIQLYLCVAKVEKKALLLIC